MTEEETSNPQTSETSESAETTESGQGQADPQGTSGKEAVAQQVKSNESTSAEPAQEKPQA